MKRRLALAATLTALALLLTPREPTRVYTLFLPSVRNNKPLGMGLAWANFGAESAETLNADWWYVAGCTGDCVPQNPFGDLDFPCQPIELFLNESDGWTGAGAPQSVEQAVERSHAERARCPYTILIAGNVIDGDYYGYLADYLARGGEADLLGVHCYAGTAQRCIDLLSAFKARFAGWQMCLTEWGITDNSPGYNQVEEFRKLMRWIQGNFTCSAVYTDTAGEGYEWTKSLWLLNADRTPNERGIIYRDR